MTELHPATLKYLEHRAKKTARLKSDIASFDPSQGEGLSQLERFALLRRLAEVVVTPLGPTELARRRRQFDSVKNSKFPLRLTPLNPATYPCWMCRKRDAVHRHHVILLKNGGPVAAKRNIVLLCDLCHSEIHPWMNPSHATVSLSLARLEVERAKNEAIQLLEDLAKGKFLDWQLAETRLRDIARSVFNKLEMTTAP